MKIGVVIVTYNRLQQLKIAISAYTQQTFLPSFIIIVDNNSNQDTAEYLNKWKAIDEGYKKYVIRLNENLGGSGGFHSGLKFSLDIDYDWIWVADDDAYPNIDAFEKMVKFINTNSNIMNKVSALCSCVINEGIIDESHRRRIQKSIFKINQYPVSKEEYKSKCFDIDLFSYVGAFIKKNTLIRVGITEKDYFIYYDDTEHSTRIRKLGRILCIPDSKVVHNSKSGSTFNWKNYYGTRNKIVYYRTHYNPRYFCYEIIKIYAKCILRKYNKIEVQMYKLAVKDALKNKMGKNSIYKPGWNA